MKLKRMLQVIGVSLTLIGFIWMFCFPNIVEETTTVSEQGYTTTFYYRYIDFWNFSAFLLEVIGLVFSLIGSLTGEREIILQQT